MASKWQEKVRITPLSLRNACVNRNGGFRVPAQAKICQRHFTRHAIAYSRSVLSRSRLGEKANTFAKQIIFTLLFPWMWDSTVRFFRGFTSFQSSPSYAPEDLVPRVISAFKMALAILKSERTLWTHCGERSSRCKVHHG